MRSVPAASGLILSAMVLAVVGDLSAQVNWRPSPPPVVTANNENWFNTGEPITFSGNLYFPAGPQVFFDANRMVRTGSYRGVPLYADTTLEPYSKVFVPLSGGLMQPYERKRADELAGSTGSQAPSFPISTSGEAAREWRAPFETAQAAAPPMLGQPSDLVQARAMTDAAEAARRATPPQATAGSDKAATTSTAGYVPPRHVIQLGLKPLGLNEIFVNYDNARWRAAGKALGMAHDRFVQIGTYRGFPVYAEKDDAQTPHRIYLPSRNDFVAPYEKAGTPVKQ